MAAAFELTTLAKVKAHISSAFGTSTADDDYLGDIISEVSTQAEQVMGRQVDAIERTEEYDAYPRMRQLELEQYPVSAVSSIKVATDGDFASATALDSDTYRFEASTGLLYFTTQPIAVVPGYTAWRAVQVVYTGGMAADQSAFIAAYPDIASAITRQVAHAHHRRQGLGAGTVDLNRSQMVHTSEYGFLKDTLRVLRSYRRPIIG